MSPIHYEPLTSETAPALRYVLYARKSSESEDRQVQSIDDQLAELRRLAYERGLNIVRELTESKSAKAPGQRPVFGEVLALVNRGEADAVLCWSLNRLSRNPVDSGTLAWLLQQRQLSAIQTVDKEYRPEDNVLLMAVESGVANQFILDLRKAVVRGMQSKRDKGVWPHRAPEGYLNDRDTRTIEPDKERFDLLRKAWEMLLTGAYTVPQVREQLTEWGYQTRKQKRQGGKPISRTALYDLFSNPFYAGHFFFDGKRYQGAHKPMVSETEFERVQALLHRAQHPNPKKYEWAYSGLIRCAVCGCLVVAERKVRFYKQTNRTAVYVYYHCSGSKGCTKASVTDAHIDGKLAALLDVCRFHPDALPWLDDVVERHFAEDAAPDDAAYRMQQEAGQAARKRLNALTAMRADGEIGRDEYAVQRERLLEEIGAAERRQRALATKRERDKAAIRQLVTFCGTASARFTEGGARERREVAHALGTGYFLNLGNVEITPFPALDAIRTFEPQKNGSDKEKVAWMLPDDPAWCPLLDCIWKAVKDGSALP